MSKQWRCSYTSVSSEGIEIVNTFHVVDQPTPASSGDASADQVRDTLDAALTTKYRAILGTSDLLQTLTVRQEVDPGSGDVPEESVKSIGLNGTRTGVTTKDLSGGLCMLVAVNSNAAVRGGKGRMWMPPAWTSSVVTAGGIWASSSLYWVNVKAFMDEMLVTHNTGGSVNTYDINWIVYSRTRRARGDANYWFDVSGYTMRPAQHFLRTRTTAP